MITINPQDSIGTIAAQNPSFSTVLERLGLDFCCGGQKSLSEACAERGIDPGTVATMLEAIEPIAERKSSAVDPNCMGLTELADHIEQTHHAFLCDELPRIGMMLQKVVAAHGEHDHRLAELAKVFSSFIEEIESHMAKEEQVLFPMVRQIENAKTMPAFHCGSMSNPIRVMEQEHEAAADALRKMHELTDGYCAPEHACPTYRSLLASLENLERDMHQHIHKENNILFPKAIEIERSLSVGV